MTQPPPPTSDAPRISVLVVGTLNFMDACAHLCNVAGLEPIVKPLIRYARMFSWMFSKDMRRCSMIYQFGAGGVKYLLISKLFGKPVIKHWIGSDVHRLVDGRGFRRNVKVWIYRHFAAMHLAVNDQLKDRLAMVGIEARRVRMITSMSAGTVEPLPETFTVLSYWTPDRLEFYGGDIVLQLAGEFPEIPFVIVGTDGDEAPDAPANVEFLGYRKDMPTIFPKCSALIRIPKTDGAPNMPLEMASRGRYVLYNKPLEGSRLVSGIDDLRTQLNELQHVTEPDHDAAREVNAAYCLQTEAQKFHDYIEQWLTAHRAL